MEAFDQNHLNNIKAIFREKTGVEPAPPKRVRRPVRTALVLAAAVACFTATALAASLFSALEGDDLALAAQYQGDGVVSIQVENRSDKELRFQPQLKLMRWTTGEEVEPLSDAVVFQGTEIAPHSSGTMTIDLSRAYDMERLEEPLTDDWYYLVLTNNGFLFGHDWMCSVEFGETVNTPVEYPAPGEADAAIMEDISEQLRPYFETISFETGDRREMDAQYIQAYTELLAGFEGTVVSSVSPVLPGNRISLEMPYLLVDDPAPGVVIDDSVPLNEQQLLVGQNFHSRDANFKMLATEGEYALVLSAALPSERYGEGNSMPLLYILTYEKDEAGGEDACAFIYGRLMPFADLERYQVYEDDRYVCYEVSGLIYSDLTEYTREYSRRNPDIPYNEEVQARVDRVYAWYRENLGSLLNYK